METIYNKTPNADMKKYGWLSEPVQIDEKGEARFAARIISQSRTLYRAVCQNGELMAEVSGKLQYDNRIASDYPAVGDFVLLDRDSDDSGNALIHKVLPRKSVFIRKAAGTANQEQVVAANIDTVFICMALNNDFNIRRLERYMTIAWDSGATPVVVLTKSDLCRNITEKLIETEAACMGAEILVTSALEDDGITQIAPYISEGKTIALIGSSGVGKSTLINRLIGNGQLETNGLRNDDKGRHTTTRRELILLPQGGMVMDTPGMREMGIWDVNRGLDKTFEDVEVYFDNCRFSNCTHTNEPGCAVLKALRTGELSEERWLSYQKLKQEAAYSQDKESYLINKEEKFKAIAKLNKNSKKRQ